MPTRMSGGMGAAVVDGRLYVKALREHLTLHHVRGTVLLIKPIYDQPGQNC
jgi:hypothetical protein